MRVRLTWGIPGFLPAVLVAWLDLTGGSPVVAVPPNDLPEVVGPDWDDWPQFGGSPWRNNVRLAQNLPADWDPGEIDLTTGEWKTGTGRNVRWVARLGGTTHGSPVVSGGKVFIGTNNMGGRLARFPYTIDLVEGKVTIFKLSERNVVLGQIEMGQSIYSTPIAAGGVLYLATKTHLYAIAD